MNHCEAEAILHDDTHKDDGTYTLLRLGINPGAEAVHSLISALRIIRQRYSDEQSIPHQVAFYCGIILHFASECIQNLKASDTAQSLLDSVDDPAMAAFNALAGNKGKQNEYRPKKKLGIRAFIMLYIILVLITFAISCIFGGNFR